MFVAFFFLSRLRDGVISFFLFFVVALVFFFFFLFFVVFVSVLPPMANILPSFLLLESAKLFLKGLLLVT